MRSFEPAQNAQQVPGWYVAQTLHHREMRAAHELEAQGFGAFVPLYLKRRSHARRMTLGPAPLFPNYLFVSFDPTRQRWRCVNGTIGVARLIMGIEGPARVTPGIVEGLMASRDDKGFIALPKRPNFVRGEAVRITAGVFAAGLGLFEDFSDQDRVAVLLDLLGRKVRVVLGEDCVEKAA